MNTVFALFDFQFRGWFPDYLAVTLGLLAVAVVGTLYVLEGVRAKVRPVAMVAAIPVVLIVAAVLIYRGILAYGQGNLLAGLYLAGEVLAGGAIAVLLPIITRRESGQPVVVAGAIVAGLVGTCALLLETAQIVMHGSAAYVAAPWLLSASVVGVAVFCRASGYPGVLAGVRIATVVTVALLLLRPAVVSETTGENPRPVAVLIDVSQSMNSTDARPAAEDQWRAALAFGLHDPDKPLPRELPSAGTRDAMKEAMGSNKPSRIAIARAALTNPKLDLFARLRKIGPLEVSTFGPARTVRDGGSADWLKTVSADQSPTALVNAAFELLNRGQNDLPAAVVIVTDGLDNASTRTFTELAALYREKNIPLYIYGVGSSAFGQLRLRDAAVPESVFQGDTVSVPVRYSLKGVTSDGRVDIKVYYGDNPEPVAQKLDLPAVNGDNLREVLTFVPTPKEAESPKQEVRVTVTVTTGDGTTTETLTDSTTKPSRVVKKRLRVLVVDGLPRVDFKFLQRALMRDPQRIDAHFFLTEGDREAMQSGYPWLKAFTNQLDGTLRLNRVDAKEDAKKFRALLGEYNLLILGDVPGKFFNTDYQQVIKDFVTEGGGLIHIAGRWNAPAGWAAAPADQASIADLLPVEVAPKKFPISPPTGRYYPPFVPVLAPNAARNPLVALEDDAIDNAELWGRAGETPVAPGSAPPRAAKKNQLPPLDWYYPSTRVKKGAEVFLVHPTDTLPAVAGEKPKPMPLLAGHYYGKGYVLFCAFDDTWRWRFNVGDKYFARFWGQSVYQAGLPGMVGTNRTQLSLSTPEPVVGKSTQVYARILGEDYKALTVSEVEGTLEKLDPLPNEPDQVIRVYLRKFEDQDGDYVGLFKKEKDGQLVAVPFDRTGRFRLTVTPPNKSPATLEYRVNLPPNHELAPGAMARVALKNLAEASGNPERPGKFYHEEDLYELPNEVQPQYAPFERKVETLLWDWRVLLLLIGLLSVEWFLRKFNGLS